MTITVFVLDDHEMVRRGLRDILATEDDIEVIGEAGTVDEGARGIVGMATAWRFVRPFVRMPPTSAPWC